jgi:hypothetical protein
MDRVKALFIIHSRMLGTSFRRIAELFGEDSKQSTGQNLVEQAAVIMGIDVVELESSYVEKRLDTLHLELGIFTVEELSSKIINGGLE